MKWVFGVLACIAAADDSSSLLQHARLSAKPDPLGELSKEEKKDIKKELKMGTRMMLKVLSGGGDEAQTSAHMARKLLKKALEGKLPRGLDMGPEGNNIRKELVDLLKNGPQHELEKAKKQGLVTEAEIEDDIEGAEEVVEAVEEEVVKDVEADIRDGTTSPEGLQKGVQKVLPEIEKEAAQDGASPDQIASVEDAVGSAVALEVAIPLLQRSTGSQFSNLIAKFHSLPDERRKALAKFAATDVEDSQALLAKWQSIPMNHRKELLQLLQLANGADASSMDDAAVLKGKKKKSTTTPSGGPVTD